MNLKNTKNCKYNFAFSFIIYLLTIFGYGSVLNIVLYMIIPKLKTSQGKEYSPVNISGAKLPGVPQMVCANEFLDFGACLLIPKSTILTKELSTSIGSQIYFKKK